MDKWAGLVWAELRNNPLFSSASRYVLILLAFGSETDPNSNSSSLVCLAALAQATRDAGTSTSPAMRSQGRLTQPGHQRCIKHTGLLVQLKTEVRSFSYICHVRFSTTER